jgi:hypothetical protein
VEDVVALEVKLRTGELRYFVTWGRLFDPIDPTRLIESARTHMSEAALGGEIESVRLCDSLREAKDAPYFFEALLSFAQQQIPRADDHEAWRARMRSELAAGKQLYFLGSA